ncbi:hypothetical protein [Fischerella sp. JS2]|uniref:hypothetical protein n=1 Tax=Fischerella sp. JS2 TaxID=2597771 RepID=UPI0028F01BEB|nr:hypothetical protein [Fischerella sp. JS2]
MTQIILCRTLTKGWINLAYARQVQFCQADPNIYKEQVVCVITWSNGDQESFFGKDAQLIAQTWRKYTSYK